MSRVFNTRGFFHGFTWGTGRGTDLCTPEKPVPRARVHGFDEISNSARKRGESASSSLISAHYNLSTITTTPKVMDRDSKGGEMDGASTHFHKKVCFHWKLAYILIQIFADYMFHHPRKRVCACLFWRVVSCSSPPPTHHPEKRAACARGWFLIRIITTTPPPLKTSMHACF